MKQVEVYTDGACSGNPGPGGWGAVLRYRFNGKVYEKELSGGDASTTNNRMELTAFIEALRQLKEPCEVRLCSDSQYVINGLEKGWTTGAEVHLEGDAAYQFIHYRDTAQEQSAEARLERQKQYLKKFILQAKEAMKQDMTLPLQLYTQITPYMVTDVTADEAVYLAGQALSYSFGDDDFYSMTGTVKMGEKFEEFYPDETALYELVLDVFYEEAAD